MITKLIFGVIFVGLIVFLVIGFEVHQIRKLKIPDAEINNCFKEVNKWKS